MGNRQSSSTSSTTTTPGTDSSTARSSDDTTSDRGGITVRYDVTQIRTPALPRTAADRFARRDNALVQQGKARGATNPCSSIDATKLQQQQKQNQVMSSDASQAVPHTIARDIKSTTAPPIPPAQRWPRKHPGKVSTASTNLPDPTPSPPAFAGTDVMATLAESVRSRRMMILRLRGHAGHIPLPESVREDAIADDEEAQSEAAEERQVKVAREVVKKFD